MVAPRVFLALQLGLQLGVHAGAAAFHQRLILDLSSPLTD
jgi:hypothetical protein